MTQPISNLFSYITNFFMPSAVTPKKPEKPFDPTAAIRPDSSTSEEITKALREGTVDYRPLSAEELIARDFFRGQVTPLSEPTAASAATKPKKQRKIRDVYQPHVQEGTALLRERGVRHDLQVLASPVGRNDFPLSGNNPSPFDPK
jgi:hypothetical protein